MTDLLPALVWVACAVLLMLALARLATRVRRRGLGGSLMAPFDQVWHGTAYESHLERQEQERRATPVPAPADPPADPPDGPTSGSAQGRP